MRVLWLLCSLTVMVVARRWEGGRTRGSVRCTKGLERAGWGRPAWLGGARGSSLGLRERRRRQEWGKGRGREEIKKGRGKRGRKKGGGERQGGGREAGWEAGREGRRGDHDTAEWMLDFKCLGWTNCEGSHSTRWHRWALCHQVPLDLRQVTLPLSICVPKEDMGEHSPQDPLSQP